MPFLYEEEQIDAIERSLSTERFSGYIRAASGNRQVAIRLYERNTRLSESLYGVVQGLEVCLRNAVHRALAEGYGPDWYERIPHLLQYPLPERIQAAKDSILHQGKLLTPGRVVAELSFGFWTALIARKYEKRLWVPYLHKAFPHAFQKNRPLRQGHKASMLNRAEIASRLESTRNLRNRIAHHEPILDRKLEHEYCQILEATEWVCPHTAAWIGATSGFPQRFAEPPPWGLLS